MKYVVCPIDSEPNSYVEPLPPKDAPIMQLFEKGEEVFRITSDYELLFTDKVTPKEAGKMLADNFNCELKHRTDLQAKLDVATEALKSIAPHSSGATTDESDSLKVANYQRIAQQALTQIRGE